VGSFDRQNRYLIVQVSGPEGPTDLWRYELATGATLRLTYSATGGLDPASFVQPRAVRYQSFDGLEISALLYEPPGVKPAGGWPAIITAHGGPEGQVRPWFDPLSQLYLSKGVALLMPNVRGSDGFGKAFGHLDDVALRENSVRDYVAAREWLVAQGIADPARIAITGGSYGGYVVLAALTLYPDKWAAGVCSVGIANFVTFLENTAPYRRVIREAEYGSLEHDRALLTAISPIHKAQNITAPLLLIHGANDPRVPIGEAQQMYDSLKALGREVELLTFPDEGHGVDKLENRAIEWQKELEFLGKHLRF
jgi:dipeptidyl aminopeptidase/acylaminoacyl peptidase